MIDLRRLYVLRAVSHYGTVTAAAKALHLSPSAASQQIRQLAKELDVTLLEPQGRNVRLTPAANVLLSHADAIEARWRRAETDLHATGTEPGGKLRLCGFATAIATLLAATAELLHARYPAIDVRLREAEASECFDLLFAGDADLAIVEANFEAPPLDDIRFDQKPLFDDPFDLVTAADHPLAERDSVALTDTARERWILGLPGSTSRQHVLAACSNAGFSPSVAHEASEWSVVATLVAHHLGIALVPRLAELPPHLALARVPIAGPHTPYRHFLSCTRRGSREYPTIAAASEAIEEIRADRDSSSADLGAVS
ncbi:MAG: LysR substrate-binding domain-containing protein [Stackebrandtia sp.]